MEKILAIGSPAACPKKQGTARPRQQLEASVQDQQWKNAKGEIVIMTAETLKVLPKGVTVAQAAAREATLQRARQAERARGARVEAIEAAVKDTGVAALLNEETGVVAFVKPPVPYWAPPPGDKAK